MDAVIHPLNLILTLLFDEFFSTWIAQLFLCFLYLVFDVMTESIFTYEVHLICANFKINLAVYDLNWSIKEAGVLKAILCLGLEQNLHWKLGRLTPSFGFILAVRLKKDFF